MIDYAVPGNVVDKLCISKSHSFGRVAGLAWAGRTAGICPSKLAKVSTEMEQARMVDIDCLDHYHTVRRIIFWF